MYDDSNENLGSTIILASRNIDPRYQKKTDINPFWLSLHWLQAAQAKMLERLPEHPAVFKI
jgi:hypothetical protein